MARSGGRRRVPFYKQSWFMGLSAAVVLIGGVLGLLGSSLGIFGGLKETFKPEKLADNIEVILDRSAGMSEFFDGVSKIEAAGDAVKALVTTKPASINFALREFGGACDEKYRLPEIPFNSHNQERITSALNRLQVRGGANLFKTILDAIADFSDANGLLACPRRSR